MECKVKAGIKVLQTAMSIDLTRMECKAMGTKLANLILLV